MAKTTATNPRYTAYCRAHGETDPNVMLDKDDVTWPGARMTGYVLWVQARWREWRELRGRRESEPLSREDHTDFDAWLDAKVESAGAQ